MAAGADPGGLFPPSGAGGEKTVGLPLCRRDYLITVLYDSSVKYRLVEERGPRSFTLMEDGRLFTRWGFSNPEEAVGRFLSFGSLAQVIDPPEMAERMRREVKKIAFLYNET